MNIQMSTDDCCGQASVEAASLLPILLLMLCLLLQPACLLYPRIMMCYAAGDVGRMAATVLLGGVGSHTQEHLEELVRTRLSGVLPTSIFHVGGAQDWDVKVSIQEWGESGEAHICIGHRIKPLPLFSPLLGALGALDGEGNLYQEISTTVRLQPIWAGDAR